MCQKNIKWGKETDAIFACCGKWQAELACDEPYTPGLVFITPKGNGKSLPTTIGDGEIDDLESLFKLINEISSRMREHLMCTVHDNCKCENVYLLSLNENKTKSPLHFRLWPKYVHDAYLMDLVDETGERADALALMAERRHQFLLRQSTGRWDNWPPSHKNNPEAWTQYALSIRRMLIP